MPSVLCYRIALRPARRFQGPFCRVPFLLLPLALLLLVGQAARGQGAMPRYQFHVQIDVPQHLVFGTVVVTLDSGDPRIG
jgi:hypothetical protein